MRLARSRRAGRRARLGFILLIAGAAVLPLAIWSAVSKDGALRGFALAGPMIGGEAVVPANSGPGRSADEIVQQAAAVASDILDTRERTDAQDLIRQEVVEVSSGDTLIALLQNAGLGAGDAYGAANALQEVFRPQDLRPGQQIELALEQPEGPEAAERPRLAALSLRASAEEDVKLYRDDEGGFVAETVARALDRRIDGAVGVIERSLFADAENLGIPPAIMLETIRGFSYAVDFQRDLQEGDRFEVIYETLEEPDGQVAKLGDLLYAAVEVRDERLEMYRHELADGTVDYFDADGESLRRLLMRTPIDGARLSSGFGMRKHPVLGYSRMHRGVDFAAPPGTPIYAAGNGVVEVAGRNRGYGNYIRLRHNGPYRTVYAHLQGFASGIQRGARVSQGEVIGYVGATGMATGPHLHYEVHVDGEQVNPRSLDLPTGHRLTGDERQRFRTVMQEIDTARADLDSETRIAQAEERAAEPE